MNFSFNFDIEGYNTALEEPYSTCPPAAAENIFDIRFVPTDHSATEVVCPDESVCVAAELIEFEYNGVRIARIAAPVLSTGRIDATHDLIPGQYEGGLKLWECSVDLVSYYLAHFELHTGSCLELGCGQGLPGVATLLKGCNPVVFSDFNDDVLSSITWPNILINCGAQSANARCIAGDWMSLSASMEEGKFDPDLPYLYDIILSAETLYSVESSAKILHMLFKHLKPGGTALIATKRYYFGVGGGSMDFLSSIESQHRGALTARIVATFEDGSSNIREIIQVTK